MLSSHVIYMLRGSPGILHGDPLSHYWECDWGDGMQWNELFFSGSVGHGVKLTDFLSKLLKHAFIPDSQVQDTGTQSWRRSLCFNEHATQRSRIDFLRSWNVKKIRKFIIWMCTGVRLVAKHENMQIIMISNVPWKNRVLLICNYIDLRWFIPELFSGRLDTSLCITLIKSRSTASAQLSAYAYWLPTHRQSP